MPEHYDMTPSANPPQTSSAISFELIGALLSDASARAECRRYATIDLTDNEEPHPVRINA